MSLKRRLFFGFAGLLFLAIVALGTMLAINRQSKPALLHGIQAEIISKEEAFYKDPTSGKMQQVTLTSMSKVDREALLKKITGLPKGVQGTAFFYPAGDDTILVEIGPAKTYAYWASYVTTLGKPPSKAYATTSKGKTEWSLVAGAKGSAPAGSGLVPAKAAPSKKSP